MNPIHEAWNATLRAPAKPESPATAPAKPESPWDHVGKRD